MTLQSKSPFITENFLLQTEAARRLYFDYAEAMPVEAPVMIAILPSRRPAMTFPCLSLLTWIPLYPPNCHHRA